MLIERRIVLDSPILAAAMNNRATPPRREFRKSAVANGDGKTIVRIPANMERWQWAFLEARDALGLHDVAVSAIIPKTHYDVGFTSTYNRRFRRGEGGQQVREAFESISAGRVVTWQFTLASSVPPGHGDRFIRPPTEQEFDAMLSHIGEYLGMSEWGQTYGYGRFRIQKFNDEKAKIPDRAG